MSALRHPSTEFPAGVTPEQAIAFALSICGIKVGAGSGTVGFVLYALARCGFQTVPNNVIPLKGEDRGARSRG